MMRLWFILFVILEMALPAYAERFTIRIHGRESITVTKNIIQLSDVADVSSPRVQDDEVILALNKIEIAKAPNPGETIALPAHDVIERLEAAGVKLRDVGYTFPRIINIKRASRSLSQSEVQNALNDYVRRTEPDASIRQVTFDSKTEIAPDARIIEVMPAALGEGNQQRFALTLAGIDRAEQRISVNASIDRWTEVAVIRRPIARGKIVESADVAMARFNARTLPSDAVTDPAKVIGLETKRDLSAGEVLQSNKLEIPIVIKSGEKVTLRYKSSLIEATATGIAIEAAGMQQPVRIKNEASNKVVSGLVIAPGIVEVK